MDKNFFKLVIDLLSEFKGKITVDIVLDNSESYKITKLRIILNSEPAYGVADTENGGLVAFRLSSVHHIYIKSEKSRKVGFDIQRLADRVNGKDGLKQVVQKS